MILCLAASYFCISMLNSGLGNLLSHIILIRLDIFKVDIKDCQSCVKVKVRTRLGLLRPSELCKGNKGWRKVKV